MFFILIYLLTILIFKWVINNTNEEIKMLLMQTHNLDEQQYNQMLKYGEIVALIPVLNTVLLIIAIIRGNVH